MRYLIIFIVSFFFHVPQVSALDYNIQGTNAFVYGEIGTRDPRKFERMIAANPKVKTLVLMDVPGSFDDDANLRLVAMVRARGLNTHLTKNSIVESGGTDLFLGGVRRTIEPGARVGVHSWADDQGAGVDAPRNDPVHQLYLNLYRRLGIPSAFYWFTLEAAGPDDIHYMSLAEMRRFKMLTR